MNENIEIKKIIENYTLGFEGFGRVIYVTDERLASKICSIMNDIQDILVFCTNWTVSDCTKDDLDEIKNSKINKDKQVKIVETLYDMYDLIGWGEQTEWENLEGYPEDGIDDVDENNIGLILQNGIVIPAILNGNKIFKSFTNFLNKEGICYIPNKEFIENANVYNIDEYKKTYTYENLLDLCANNETILKTLFDKLDSKLPEDELKNLI